MSRPLPWLKPFVLVAITSVAAVTALTACGSSASSSSPRQPAEGVAESSSPAAQTKLPAPAFTLPSAQGQTVSLSQFRGEKPVVLVFYRAYWCTFCRAQLNELQKNYTGIRAAGAEVLAVSTDNLQGAGYSLEAFGVEFPILYTSLDPAVPQSYGVFNLFGDGLASASVFIIDSDGNVAWKSVGASYTHQVSGQTVIEQVRALNT